MPGPARSSCACLPQDLLCCALQLAPCVFQHRPAETSRAYSSKGKRLAIVAETVRRQHKGPSVVGMVERTAAARCFCMHLGLTLPLVLSSSTGAFRHQCQLPLFCWRAAALDPHPTVHRAVGRAVGRAGAVGLGVNVAARQRLQNVAAGQHTHTPSRTNASALGSTRTHHHAPMHQRFTIRARTGRAFS